MKTETKNQVQGAGLHVIALATIVSLCAQLPAPAQVTNFNSGSDGSYGQLNVTVSTNLVMPTNGIFNCTTITVASGATLTFTRNPLNTPVYLLATGDVNINGTIDVSGGNNSGRTPGVGGPGGFDGGYGGYGGAGFGGTGRGGDGLGPGGGIDYDNCGDNANFSYGNSLLVPLIGGSGGAGTGGNPGSGGGGGGGAILIGASTRIVVNGAINSSGGSGVLGAGSGGAIRLIAPIVTGNGSLNTPGSVNACGIHAGSGRSRIDCLDGNAVRSLNAVSSVSSRGVQMFVFPPVQPRLDITQAAGQSIPFGTGSLVSIFLPEGTTSVQTIVVQATSFTNSLPITVAVIPSDRGSSTYQAVIAMTNTPATVTVPVNLAVDSTNRIMVWANY